MAIHTPVEVSESLEDRTTTLAVGFVGHPGRRQRVTVTHSAFQGASERSRR